MLGPRLGKGSYAKVKLGERIRDGCIVAVKIINRHKAAKEFVEKFLPRELSIQLGLSHKNIIRVYEVINQVDIVCVIMEYAGGGDLLDYVKRRGWLAEPHAGNIFAQICSGVQYLHGRGICHRDLKCENILLRRDFSVALSDFGFSKRLARADSLSDTYCGSAAYASPDLLRGQPYRPLCNDMWSLGCVLYVMITGRMPFYDKNTKKMMYRQLKGKVNFPEHKHVTALCRDVISHILEPNATKRYAINDVIRHPWVEPHISFDDSQIEDDEKSAKPQSSILSQMYTVRYEDLQRHLTAKHLEHFEGPLEPINSPDTSFKDPFGGDDSMISEFSIVSNNSETSITSEASQYTPGSKETRSLSRMPGEECILRKQSLDSGTKDDEEIIHKSEDVQKPKGWSFFFWNRQKNSTHEKSEREDNDDANVNVKICPGENCLLPKSKPRFESTRQTKQPKRDESSGLLKRHCNTVLRIPNGTPARLLSPEVKNEGGQGLHFVTYAPRDHSQVTEIHNKRSNQSETTHVDVSMETHPHGNQNTFRRDSDVALDDNEVVEHPHWKIPTLLKHPKSVSEPASKTEKCNDVFSARVLSRPSSFQTFSPRPFKKHHHHHHVSLSKATTALPVMPDVGPCVGSPEQVTTPFESVYQDVHSLDPSIASDKVVHHQDDLTSNQSLCLYTMETQQDSQTRMSAEVENVHIQPRCSKDSTVSDQTSCKLIDKSSKHNDKSSKHNDKSIKHNDKSINPSDSSKGIVNYIDKEEPPHFDLSTVSEPINDTRHKRLFKQDLSSENFPNKPSQLPERENSMSQDSSLSEKPTNHQNDSCSEKSDSNTKQTKALSRKSTFHPTNISSDSIISTPTKHMRKVGRVSLMRRKFESQEASTSVGPDS